MWWSVAEGRRGRRWREAVVGERGLRHALLLETTPDARFSHLELASSAGLLTLHPEGDGTLHGNVLASGGLRHVVGLPWADGGLVVVGGSPVSLAAAAHTISREPVPSGTTRRVLRVNTDLMLEIDELPLAEAGPGRWRLGDDLALVAGLDGLPAVVDGLDWPLELDA